MKQYHVRILLPFLLLSLLTGCRGGKKQTEPETLSGRIETRQTEETAQTETEELLEAETEEIDYRSVLEVLDRETLEWAESFDEERVKRFTYTNMGEEKNEYELTDPHGIRKFYDALMELMVAGRVDTYAYDAGDTFTFEMKDGRKIRFEFIMSCIFLDGQLYETDHGDALWELTGALMAQDLL